MYKVFQTKKETLKNGFIEVYWLFGHPSLPYQNEEGGLSINCDEFYSSAVSLHY